MKNVLRKRSFKIDVFDATVHIYMCGKGDAILHASNRVIKKFKEGPIEFEIQGLAFSPDQQPNHFYLFLSSEYLDVNTVTHETQHILIYIADYYCIDEKNDSKEVLANLNGYINQKVFAFIRECGMQINY